MKELLIIKEPLSLIVTVSTSCSLICSPTTPPALSPSVPLSCALSCSILPPLTWFLTQSRKKIRNVPQLIFSSSCISNCVFTNKLGEVAEDIWPGARPVLSFPLSFPHPPPFPAPTVLDSPYSPHLFSLDHDLRYELPYTRFDSSSSLLLLLALHQIMTTADSAPPCLYRCTMIM